ncbi:hypothetical protein AOQ84DRAFT_419727 [Glonium stellatum]|uniref:Heterokaryon incompatibility domain-containing protein n=1 Tax=Glonium stellatum TaxID=574774 RepID=A0A8E2ERY1_9PEZI|nr:hypothetical protein AOQ84DRAFT_419727 [Glonium stellatum]
MLNDGKSDCYYWTDSLCINYNDSAEISRQVTRTGEIYSCVKQVIVWLGHEQTGKDAMKLVHDSLSDSVLEDVNEDAILEAAIYLLLRPF